MALAVPSYQALKTAVRRAGFRFFGPRAFDLNLVGIRSRVREPDAFDDLIVVAYVDERGREVVSGFEATTDPGLAWLTAGGKGHPRGTAVLARGQYRGMLEPGLHGRSGPTPYRALVQVSPCTVRRDDNDDRVLDTDGALDTGIFGINLHRQSPSGRDADDVVGWASAGCQVVRFGADLTTILGLVARQAAAGLGSRCTYTLLDEVDLG